jgi:hypothetical protein
MMRKVHEEVGALKGWIGRKVVVSSSGLLSALTGFQGRKRSSLVSRSGKGIV